MVQPLAKAKISRAAPAPLRRPRRAPDRR
jgi:hypothetical protein